MPGDAPRSDLLALGQALRRHRDDRGWTLNRLADEAGVSRRTVINAESGAHAISIDHLIDLAAALGVRASDLLAEAEVDDQ